MADRRMSAVIQHLRRLVSLRETGDLADGQLVERFARERDEAAFTALVERHGPMVLGVCRRVLHNGHDVEDAFQATFLIFVRKAGSLGRADLVGNWLYGVAYRTASRARATASKRREEEYRDVQEYAEESADIELRDLRRVLDEELNRLPEKYRRPLVLCYLEGHSHEEAAQRLGCPKGTFQTRLARGRDRLRQRLTRRGVTLSAAGLAAALSTEALAVSVPPALAATTVSAAMHFAAGGAALGIITRQTAALAEGVLQAMFMTKLKIAAAVLLTVGLAGSGAGMLSFQTFAADDGKAKRLAEKPAAAVAAAPQEKGKRADNTEGGGTIAGPVSINPDPSLEFFKLADKMNSIIPKFNCVDDPKTTLEEALQSVIDRYELRIDVNEKAFASDQVPEVLKTPITESRPVPEMHNVRLSVVLGKILQRVPNAMYVIRRDHVEVTTVTAVRAEVGLPAGESPPLLPLVHLPPEPMKLDEALERVAKQADYNVVLDPRAADARTMLVKASLRNVPLDYAVRLLADMAELKVVQLGNVLYVTTKENAAKWEKEKMGQGM